jgi:hypothetical protein
MEDKHYFQQNLSPWMVNPIDEADEKRMTLKCEVEER